MQAVQFKCDHEDRASANRGRTTRCRECARIRVRKAYKESPEARERRLDYLKKWRRDNPDKTDYYAKNRDRVKERESRLKTVYNLTVDQYNQMLVDQNFVCAICKDQPKQFYIDHCHKSGKVRGLLCSHCNFFIGLAKESIQTLQSAIEYIKRS